jgi:23S rRNA (adenine2503-C2)-methyltransferase
LALFLLALFRALLCERSQFCATGTMGLSGNLTTGEILEQVVHADRILALQWHDIKNRADGSQRIPKLDLVRNVVFMGMGEVRCAC